MIAKKALILPTMENKKKYRLQLFLLLSNLVIASIICTYFWFYFKDYTKKVDVAIMILALVYTLLEIIKKAVHVVLSKWNRIFYFGLLAVVAPTAFENKLSPETMQIICNVGVVFLIVPIFVESILLKKFQNNSPS